MDSYMEAFQIVWNPAYKGINWVNLVRQLSIHIYMNHRETQPHQQRMQNIPFVREMSKKAAARHKHILLIIKKERKIK